MKYIPMRDLLLVRKIKEEKNKGGIVLPDSKRQRFIRLEVLVTGRDVDAIFKTGDIVHAENMYEPVDKECGVILEKYIFVKEKND